MNEDIEQVPPPRKSGKKIAIFSVLAALIAICINISGASFPIRFSGYNFTLAASAMIVVWAGFLSAIVGLIKGLRGRGKVAVWCSLIGLLLNGGVITLNFGAVSFIRSMAGRSSRTTLVQLNSMPQIFSNSVPVFEPRFGFRLELPKGFIKHPNPPPGRNVIHSYIRYSAKGMPEVVVNIMRLHGTLALRKGKPSVEQLEEFKRAMRKSLPHALLVRVEQEQWKSHTLDVFLAEMPSQGEMTSLWSVQVPLAGEAIQIQVGGLKGGEDQYRQVLVHIIKSIQGNSNWR